MIIPEIQEHSIQKILIFSEQQKERLFEFALLSIDFIGYHNCFTTWHVNCIISETDITEQTLAS
jgi:hypothetical protein